MSYELTNDSDPVPGPSFPGISADQLERIRRWLRRIRRWSIILAVLAALGIVIWWAFGVYADWLWFSQIGYRPVFVKIAFFKTGLFLIGSILAALTLSANFFWAHRLSLGTSVRSLPPNFSRLIMVGLLAVLVLTVAIAALVFGSLAADRWQVALLLFNTVSFGAADPQFGLDVSFYVVILEAIDFVQSWLLTLCITSIACSLALYISIYTLRGVSFVLTPRMLRHAAALGIFLMVIIAAGHVANIYGLTLSESGVVVSGANYTDVNARIPALWFLTGLALLTAVGFGASVYFAGLRLMVGAFTLWIIMLLLAGAAYPALFQRFQVDPDEFSREEPFIRRNLEATRAAYGLDAVEESSYPVTDTLSAEVLREHRATINNIRLWDLPTMRDAYNQLQFMELYYEFVDLDSDRYEVDGHLRQVTVGVRELNSTLPDDAQNWVNQRLQYTHGYGVAMSPANEFTPGDGRPEFFIQDIPIRGKLPVSQPGVYYGETPLTFAIVNSGMTEVNPSTDFERYDGTGGVALSSLVRRAVYAAEFDDINILLSNQVRPQSRIQYRRQIGKRVSAIAPFLKLDQDPYPVLDDAGKLWWIQDAYTITARYPYATPSGDGFNYIRNSVKAVVDAYNGDVWLYVIDSEDPLLRMYRRAFPGLFQDLAEMPPDLRRHIRYPATLLSVQAELYLRYHVTDPQVFFNQAEQWDLPLASAFGKDPVRATPSYLIIRLPGEEREEFVLLIPFSPAGQKKNLVGWLAARNDWPHYGQLKSYQLPDDRQIDGPSQVEARIQNHHQVSQQFTLWSGSGSQPIRGQILVIPIADTIVYVEPLYLRSEVLNFPELKKVILADNTNLVMADTMEEALALLVGEVTSPADAAGTPGSGSDSGSGSGSDAAPGAIAGAGVATEQSAQLDQLEQLDQIETSVNELGKALKDLEKSLESLRKTLGGDSP